MNIAASSCQGLCGVICIIRAAAFCCRETAESTLDLCPRRPGKAVELLAEEFLETRETWENRHVPGKSTMAVDFWTCSCPCTGTVHPASGKVPGGNIIPGFGCDLVAEDTAGPRDLR